MAVTDNKIISKLIDLIKLALGFKHKPQVICSQSRVSCEAILKEIYKREIGQIPPKTMFDTLFKSILKEKPGLIPMRITSLIGTIQIYGNMASHPQDELEELSHVHAEMIEKALTGTCNWFFNEYLNITIEDKLFDSQTNNIENAQLENYSDLLHSALADNILELEEYESLIEAKENMTIPIETAIDIEKKVALKLLNKNINSLSDILAKDDLESFRKFDVNKDEKPSWAIKSIEEINKLDDDESIKQLFKYYFDEIKIDQPFANNQIFNLLGCWQGWYFQYSSKTYFDLIFLARTKSEIIGFSIEPINPSWNHVQNDDKYLFAEISGQINDDIIFSYNKKYLFPNSWTINYNGVILDDGQFFEGEWNIRELNGSFNAIKTRSLLPIRIFDTNLKIPIVKTTYLDNIKILASTWLIQFVGKNTEIGLLHIIEIDYKIYANIITSENKELNLIYCEGNYEELAKVKLESVNNVFGNYPEFNIRFSIDWNNNTINGVIKDSVYLMRAFKGYKI
jgi:hypothetical protein